MILAGVLSVVAAVMMVCHIGTGAIGISTLLAFAGLAHRPCACPPIVRQENGGGQNQGPNRILEIKNLIIAISAARNGRAL